MEGSEMKTEEQLKNKISELKADERKFAEFIKDVYNDVDCENKIEVHLWKIRRQIEIINWVLNNELPF